MKTYTAHATRWEYGWVLQIAGEHREQATGQLSELSTQSHGTADAYPMVADLIETWTGEPSASFAVEITFQFLPGQPAPKWNGRRTSWLPSWVPRFQRLR